MIRQICIFFFLVLGFETSLAQRDDYNDYIEKHKKIAIKEMGRAGIPASIKLAQALLESNAGRSELARKANNHFGIKCGNDWTGKTYQSEDDDYDDFGNIQKSCFRKYRKEEDSFIAHSEYLRDPKKANRYGFLFRINPTDYRRWARGLRTSGYATDANYDNKLISIIESFELDKFDRMNMDKFPEGRPENPANVVAGLDIRKVNEVRVVFAKNKITAQEISLLTGVSLKSLAKYNERLPAPNDSLADDTRVYLQPKRCKFREKKKWHYVGENESMFDISQLYGVKLSQLYKRNHIPDGAEPQKNERIKLSGWKVKASERPRLTDEHKPTATVPVLSTGDDGFMDEEITPPTVPTTPPVAPPATNPPANPPNTNAGNNPTSPSVPPGQAGTTAQPAAPVYYTIVKGDTLYSLSKRYGTTVDEIIRLNNLATTILSIGQVLRVK